MAERQLPNKLMQVAPPRYPTASLTPFNSATAFCDRLWLRLRVPTASRPFPELRSAREQPPLLRSRPVIMGMWSAEFPTYLGRLEPR
jgi:hypothetical protein